MSEPIYLGTGDSADLYVLDIGSVSGFYGFTGRKTPTGGFIYIEFGVDAEWDGSGDWAVSVEVSEVPDHDWGSAVPLIQTYDTVASGEWDARAWVYGGEVTVTLESTSEPPILLGQEDTNITQSGDWFVETDTEREEQVLARIFDDEPEPEIPEIPEIPETLPLPPIEQGWLFDNESILNIVSANVTSEFDILRGTIPLETSSVTIENATPDNSYDFLRQDIVALLRDRDMTLRYDLGYEDTERLRIGQHRLRDYNISADNLLVTFEGEGYLGQLDKELYYGGEYHPNGLSVHDAIADILDGTNVPYLVDDDIDTLIYLPIPVVSKREAIAMVAGYAGAYVLPHSDGLVWLTRTLHYNPENQLGSFRIYDTPTIQEHDRIGRVSSALYSLSVEQPTATVLFDGDVDVSDGWDEPIRVVHTTPGLVDAVTVTNVEPGYGYDSGAYSTLIYATPTQSVLRVTITGSAYTITERSFTKNYRRGGVTVDVRCPIASDTSALQSMLDHIALLSERPTIEFKMRDDASYEVGDRINIELEREWSRLIWNYILTTPPLGDMEDVPIASPVAGSPVPVIITRIIRDFDGATDAQVTAVADYLIPPEDDDDDDDDNGGGTD